MAPLNKSLPVVVLARNYIRHTPQLSDIHELNQQFSIGHGSPPFAKDVRHITTEFNKLLTAAKLDPKTKLDGRTFMLLCRQIQALHDTYLEDPRGIGNDDKRRMELVRDECFSLILWEIQKY